MNQLKLNPPTNYEVKNMFLTTLEDEQKWKETWISPMDYDYLMARWPHSMGRIYLYTIGLSTDGLNEIFVIR